MKFLLRVGKRSRWLLEDSTSKTGWKPRSDRPEDVEEAMQDLLLRDGETGLSVYRVEDEAAAARLAALFSVTLRSSPARIDYLLIDEGVLVPPTQLASIPMSDQHPSLGPHHCEILGLDEHISRQLAGRILASQPPVLWLEEKQIATHAAVTHRDPALVPLVRERWRKRLGW